MTDWTREKFDLNNIVGMDPAANWLLGAQADTFLSYGIKETLVPFVLVRRTEGLTDVLEKVFREIDRDDKYEDVVLFDFAYGDADAERLGNQLGAGIPLMANRPFFEAVSRSSDGHLGVFRDEEKSIIISSPSDMLQAALERKNDNPNETERKGNTRRVVIPATKFSPPGCDWSSETVITGIIDDGVAFAHERFRNGEGKSRIYSFWNQNLPIWPLGAPWTGELRKNEIDNFLPPLGTPIDEDAIYRATKFIDHAEPRHKTAAWRTAHGTHALDLAAGHAPEDHRTDRPILAVELPEAIVADTLARRLDFYLIFGSLLIWLRAQEIFASGVCRKPIVINASFGYRAGPHDGKAPIDYVLEAFTQAGIVFVLPAGNAHLSRCHAQFDLTASSPVSFDWMVLPNDLTDSYFDVWIPIDGPADAKLKLTITSPEKEEYELSQGVIDYLDLNDKSGRRIGIAHFDFDANKDGQKRIMLRVDLLPTDRLRPSAEPVAPSGRWVLKFEALGCDFSSALHAWVQRDDSVYGYAKRGRQSYFLHPDYTRFDVYGREIEDEPHPEQPPCPVTRKSLLNAIATGPNVITVGGYQERDCKIARYSAGGPNIPAEHEDLRKPDVLLPAEMSRAVRGVLAAGSRSGSTVAQSGTSMAAPQLTRHVVEFLAQNAAVDRAVVKDWANALVLPECAAVNLPADRGGWGRLTRLDARPVPR
jgi:subtilisin family serine protease